MKYGGPCICGKAPLRLSLVQEGTCQWCGRGEPHAPRLVGHGARLRRLPWDLGAFVREGRRPDPHLDNVVRLDRLRDAWKVPRLAWDVVIAPEVPITLREAQVLDLAANGLRSQEIGDELGIATRAVDSRLYDVFCKLGVHKRRDAVEWWRRQEAARCELRGVA